MKFLSLSLEKILFAVVFVLGSFIYLESAQPALTPSPSDPQILKIVEVSNKGEIEISQIAAKSANEDVRKLAKDMITEHMDINSNIEKVAHQFDIKKEESVLSIKMKADSALTQTELKMLHDETFDKKYVESMVDAHQSALETFDNTLIPSAKNAQLKSALMSARKSIADHLAQARRVQAEMK